MFCGKCGTQNPDYAAFCKECGAQLSQKTVPANANTRIPLKVKPRPQRRHSAPKGKRRQDKKIGMIAVAVIVLIAAIMLLGGRSCKSTIKQYVNAQFDVDAAAIFQLIPDNMIDYMLEDDGYDRDDLGDLIDDANEAIQDQIDSIERYLGEDWKFSYKIINAEDIKGDDLKDLKKDYKRMGVNISAAKTAEVDLTVKVGETESSNSMEIPLIKVGRSWYLDVNSMGSLF